jgi:acyl-CoA thioester hydrolase
LISAVEHRVNYSETDQMGFVYHANYLIWLDMARTEHLRERGVSYKELEGQGTYLTVTDVHVRYRQPARYDDMLRIRCWVRNLASRRVIFGYAVERASTNELLATAETSLIALDPQQTLSRIPEHVYELLEPSADPVRL